MILPLCEVCVNSQILCAGCQKKLDKGLIDAADIKVSRFLKNLESNNPALRDSEIKKIFDSEILLILTKKGDGGKVVGKHGAIVKELAKEYEKPVRVIEEADFRSFLKTLLGPAIIHGINIMYAPDGETHKIRIPQSHRTKINISENCLSEITNSLFGKKVCFAFEE